MKRVVLGHLCLIWSLSGCMDPLVPGDYRGEPLIVLKGTIELSNTQDAPRSESGNLSAHQLRLAIFWSEVGLDNQRMDPISSSEQQAVTTTVFPAQFSFELHSPPPAWVMQSVDEGIGSYAIGLVLAYIDSDENDRFNDDFDWLVGGIVGRTVLYTPQGIDSPDFGGQVPRGYHAMRVVKVAETEDGFSFCDDERHLQLEATESVSLNLVIDYSFPPEVLIDVDCDGFIHEWEDDICPADLASLQDLLATECPAETCAPNMESDCPLRYCCELLWRSDTPHENLGR